MKEDRPPHPGRTAAQRKALDAIGCGQQPRCSLKTIKALLDEGLIVDEGTEIRRDALGSYRVPAYAMPIPVHMQWCSAVAATDEEMADALNEARAFPQPADSSGPRQAVRSREELIAEARLTDANISADGISLVTGYPLY